ncbi:protein of unknown function DUF72 [Rhodomicrobium vannielii ATCC 17100]|uniref:DUF72 domain-containing protein n=1 Tax=Rhodomicrobium vannielii (strain ATCC 17100 / DSM 162 / LMG 4299 / NCIMB 10020 / ATH 3.1.1) TaxID=648757 RepID=E3I2L6_RHOVT|nr:DUF72 domain-containing protein [Rhodomicrobium vannielii]ADP71375.1 protein of unknown function DUF72 [Rhodomicrobium vannielii ATCC 17100]
MTTRKSVIRAGIGGWTYEPWRGLFYPNGLPQARELAFASRAVTSIEVNGTFYRTQTPATFAKWRDETPDGFVFSVKAPRAAVMKRVLAEAGPSVERFAASGLGELGEKLGPILWQFAPTKKFDPDDMAAFLALLPRKAGGRPLRHALEVRHESFRTPAFTDLAAKAGAAIVFADSDDYPLIEESTADFVYMRLMRARADEETGYTPGEIEAWRKRAEGWAARGLDVFVYFINGAKERAPAAAQAFLAPSMPHQHQPG